MVQYVTFVISNALFVKFTFRLSNFVDIFVKINLYTLYGTGLKLYNFNKK